LKKYLIIGAIIILVIAVYLISGIGASARKIPTAMVANGRFVVTLSENGRLAAKRSMTVSAPRIRGNLQIVKLVEEGAIVKEGDFLVQFDPTEQETKLRDAEAQLKIAEANLEKAKAQCEMDVRQLELELKKAERSFSEKQSEAPVIRKEAGLELQLAQLKHDNQKRSLEAEIEKQQVEVGKAKDNLDQATRDLQKMTLTAPIPGLVVYLEIWKGSSMSKVQEGDAPWSGQGLIELPDLSSMIVETTVSEVDVSKIKKDLKAEIRLDAIPGPTFTGTITDISTLARSKQRGSQINVFDVEVLIDSADTRLKPGMSAKVDIIINAYDSVLSVPLEAVFERDDTTVVYSKSGKKIPVALGARNDASVIVTSGLEDGDEVALIDPTRKAEDGAKEQGDQTKPPLRKRDRPAPERRTVIIGG
jgi:HlyD family secretion protein